MRDESETSSVSLWLGQRDADIATCQLITPEAVPGEAGLRGYAGPAPAIHKEGVLRWSEDAYLVLQRRGENYKV